MPPQLISRSPDLARLVDEGYEVAVRGGHLVISSVPYVNAKRQVRLGTLVSDLTLAGDITARPDNHVAQFAGEYPCDQHGNPLEKIRHQTSDTQIAPGLTTHHSFSSKPAEGYADYHHKMTTYISILGKHAEAIDTNVTARTRRVVECQDPDSPFHYIDTASSRVGVNAVTRKLEMARVGIFGGGGTGAYVLDLVAKTPVGEIAIYDGDTFLQHNAFRAPGAPSIDQLRALPMKVDYLASIYSRMHRNIVPHPDYIEAENIADLGAFDFVFICMDAGPAKEMIVQYLEERGMPFVDVGMGVELVGDSLCGIVRTTTSTPAMRDHVREKKRISFAGGGAENLYANNIQIADLNALNAALAVIKWKKYFGFYKDLEGEHYSAYTIDGNALLNEDQA